MLDARHGLNNALTSILGNSELLLLEPGKLSAQVRDQVSTVHSMALRIHDVFQRFTALEHEMRIDSQSQHEIPLPPRTMLRSVSQHSDVPADQSAAH